MWLGEFIYIIKTTILSDHRLQQAPTTLTPSTGNSLRSSSIGERFLVSGCCFLPPPSPLSSLPHAQQLRRSALTSACHCLVYRLRIHLLFDFTFSLMASELDQVDFNSHDSRSRPNRLRLLLGEPRVLSLVYCSVWFKNQRLIASSVQAILVIALLLAILTSRVTVWGIDYVAESPVKELSYVPVLDVSLIPRRNTLYTTAHRYKRSRGEFLLQLTCFPMFSDELFLAQFPVHGVTLVFKFPKETYTLRFEGETNPLALTEVDALGVQPYELLERLENEYEALAAKKVCARMPPEKKRRQEDFPGANIKKRGRRRGSKREISPEFTCKLGDATVYYAHGRYEEAIPLLKEIVRICSKWLDPYETLGLIYDALGNKLKAVGLYMLAVHVKDKGLTIPNSNQLYLIAMEPVIELHFLLKLESI
ncbi:hypothetical protein L2E82_01633 [Cichorium intybus]|uniref:Uncharacterized protein n=1 Tax=Cichorium intybus TaxID=13427 RepID=A0ACB9H0Z8_CICIN|nr:hypothetical protein L2E82_01633 [Cichorium intybus]